jgi:hypothetical protein
MVHDIEVETARRIFLTGKVPMGPEAIRRQNPLDQAVRPKKSPAPFCHAISKEVRKQLREAYRIFIAAYRQASAELRAGNRNARFPEGLPSGSSLHPRRRSAGQPRRSALRSGVTSRGSPDRSTYS